MYIHINIAPWSCFGSKTRPFNYLRRSKFMAASCDGHAVNAAGDSSYVFVKNSQAVREDSADGDEQACHQLAVGSVAPVCTEAESACDKPFCNDEAAFREAECPADREEKLAVAEGSTCDAAAAGNENAPQLAVGSSDAQLPRSCSEAEGFVLCTADVTMLAAQTMASFLATWKQRHNEKYHRPAFFFIDMKMNLATSVDSSGSSDFGFFSFD